MDSNLLNSRIGLLKEWEQSESLNEILFSALSSLNTYAQERFDTLSQEIRNETAMNHQIPVIRSAVCLEENMDKQLYLYPAASNPPVNSPGYITTVFAECDYHTIQELMRHTYTAEITSGSETFKTKVALRYSAKYLQKVKWLYYIFIENDIPWTTLNESYFYKFLDVYSTDNMELNAEKHVIDFVGHEKYLSYDKMLLWNIHKLTVPVTSREIKPAYNVVMYEHVLKNKQTEDSMYLVCPMGDRFTSFWRGHELCVRTYTKKLEQIDLIRVTGGEDAENSLYLPPKSNRKKDSLIESLSKGRYIPTRGEAERIVYLLSGETGLTLVDVNTILSTEENLRKYNSVDYNYFVETNTLLKDRKLLLFTFKTNSNSVYEYETMFFVLSELQLYFYEYRCVGELI